MNDDFEELDNFMDDDPGFDFLLYEDMTQEENENMTGGCLGILLFFLIPCVSMIGFL